MTTHDESPITRTSTKRMAKGILIMVITLAFGAAIIVPFWQTMIHNPPIASTIKHEEAPPIPSGTQSSIGTMEGVTNQQQKSSANANATAGNQASTAAPAQAPTAAGPPGIPLSILKGSSVQGSPDFDPDTLTVKKGDKITVTNKDTLPHTVTSGTGPTDPNSAKQFDTSIIEPGATADIETTNIAPGDYPFHCAVHPYMTGKVVVQ
jgi:plastocyanin